MKKLLNWFSVDGYNPFNIFNMILSMVSGCSFAIIIYGLSNGDGASWDESATICLLIGIVCFLILLFRNRKLKSIPKMIIYSVISSAFCVLIVIVAFVLIVSAYLLGGLFLGGSTSQESSGNKWKKRYSNSKGEYSTDGQGHFKDQYGNDVYNPQGVTDYDKL